MSIARLRFAPSPTGYLHIGGARTAIFNWLLAKKLGGRFLLRIEDTDKARSKKEYEDDIFDALRWLGLDWDEEPLRQSSQKSFYRELVDALIHRGGAYRDFVPPDETERLKEDAAKSGAQVAFRGHQREMAPEVSDRLAESGESYAVRFKVPDEPVVFHDGVHGKVEVPSDSIEDFVIMRRDFTPTYQIAVVADDFVMSITHVIRGDDHISNTPKQVLIYKEMGWKPPQFTHVPLILGPDKKRLSKRHGASAVTDYREKGYQPESVLNYLALLGWSPGDDREVMTIEELVESFSIEGINPKSAVFDEKKLEWMNGEYLSLLPDEYLIKQLQPLFAEKVMSGEFPKGSGHMLPIAVRLLKSKARLPLDIIERNYYFFKEPETLEPKAARKRLKDPETPERLEELAGRFDALERFDETTLDETLRTYAEELDISPGKLIHPTRLAVSGQGSGPGLFELLGALGKETVVRRLRWLVGLLKEKGTPPEL